MQGAAYRFDPTDGAGSLTEANLNSLDIGGNVYQTPGQELQVNVSPLALELRTGTEPATLAYAGTTGQGVTPSETTRLYLNSSGALVATTGDYPDHKTVDPYRLATVVAAASVITSISNDRPAVLGGGTPRLTGYTVATLPAAPTGYPMAFATDGRKIIEGAGVGTGIACYWDGSASAWRRSIDDTTVVA